MDAAGDSPAMDAAAIEAPARAVDRFGDALPMAEAYVGILATRCVDWGLIGPREVPRLWDRHVLNSLAVSGFVPHESTVVDVGSGAGLPGIPLALSRPDLMITLLEPLERRASFLSDAVAELGLAERVRVVRGRAEDHDGAYDVVTCRAVAALPKLLTWTTRLFWPSGRLVALKGASAASELAAAEKDLQRRGMRGRVEAVRVLPGADETWVTIIRARRQGGSGGPRTRQGG